jgi:hypothetical protein
MRQLTLAGKKLPVVRQTAVLLTQGLPQKDWGAEINALYSFVRDRIRYVRDIRNVETLHTADRVLANKQGDCDDKSVLLASLLESLGHKTRFVAVGFKAADFNHVYVEVYVNGKWLPLETTEPVNAGWSPANVRVRMTLDNGSGTESMGTLGGKRVKKAMAAFAAKAAATAQAAAQPGATQDQIDAAAAAAALLASEQAAYTAAQAKKPKGVIGKIKAVRLRIDPVAKSMAFVKEAKKSGIHAAWAKEVTTLKAEHLKATKLMAATGSPSFKRHAKFEENKYIRTELKGQIAQVEAQRAIHDTPELQAHEADLYAQLNVINNEDKQYLKDGKIAAAIASIVIGFFTFGGGGAAVEGAFQALKQGAIDIAKKILMAAIAAALKKGGSKKDAAKAQASVDALSKYPPDPTLPTLDAMLQDSQAQQLAAQSQQTQTLGWLVPVGLALLSMIA